MEYFIILIVMFIATFILEKTHHIFLYKSRRERLEVVGIFS